LNSLKTSSVMYWVNASTSLYFSIGSHFIAMRHHPLYCI
jgi:hypothetical protein